MAYAAYIFDMDGTVLDTLEDLRSAINHALQAAGHGGNLTPEQAAACVGSGLKIALVRALCLEAGRDVESLEKVEAPGDPAAAYVPEAARILEILRPWYAAHSAEATRPYPGVPALLQRLRESGGKLAVVSNKPHGAVQDLCRRYFPGLMDLALGEREPEVRRKPAPDLVFQALKELGVRREEAVYIGDSEIDLRTAANAGTACVAVAWGFRSRRFLEAHGAAVIADSVPELERMLLSGEQVI